MKNHIFSLLGLFSFVAILSAVEPVAFTEVIKATHSGESLEISSFLGEEVNFENGKQYKITGSYRMIPRVIEGIEAPSSGYRISVIGINQNSSSTKSEHLGTLRTKDIEGAFDIRFRYEDSDYLIITMSSTNGAASGGILLSDSKTKRKIQREAEENSERLLRLLIQ